MRIISSFKDYYDGVQAHGQDGDLKYIRERKIIERERKIKAIPLSHSRYHDNTFENAWTYNFSLKFCDHIYRGLGIVLKGEGPKEFRVYNFDQIQKLLDEKKLEPNKFKSKYRMRFKWRPGDDLEKLKKYFAEKQRAEQYVLNETEMNCPAILYTTLDYGRYQITFNPLLKGLDFQPIFDPYQAYQELYMFLANIAEPRKSIPHIDDKTMVEIKGFDKRFSFRKDPEKKGK